VFIVTCCILSLSPFSFLFHRPGDDVEVDDVSCLHAVLSLQLNTVKLYVAYLKVLIKSLL